MNKTLRKYKMLKNSITQTGRKNRCSFLYALAMKELDQYKEELAEVQKIKNAGHEHFRKKEVEEKLLSYIEEDENILTIQNKYGKNIGMLAVKYGLTNIALRALDNPIASLQQD